MGADTKRFVAIDPAAIPRHFDAAEAERRWDTEWEKQGTYHYDPSRPREETFVIDTPPPTVSGSLHIGHVFSYTHTDVLARYQRMRGLNVFYPMGWDDNGVPTERRVQNHFHVRCDPHAPHDPGLKLEPATARQRKGPPRLVSRENFIGLCHDVTREDEKAFKALWRRAGLSVDWREEYATIDHRSRQLAQLSFRDLYEKGHVYTAHAPFMWDVDFQMALSQADVEDRLQTGAFHRIEFGVEGSDRGFVIATTRPELLAACVGITAHPDDVRYRDLFGRNAITPVFRVPVPIFASEAADPEKGTGILMVCTFGDATDVEWWRAQGLALRQLVGRDGRLQPVEFGTEAFPSLDPEAANRAYGEIAHKPVSQARKAMVELLRDPAGSATGRGAPLQGEPEPIEHAVKFYEKGERPLELVPSRQWFVRLLDKKAELLAKGDAVRWHPAFMKTRYRDWTENLQLDWCISRQRYFGVPIPVWYPLDAEGGPDYANPIVAERDQLPVDPIGEAPRGWDESRRDRPGGFTGEADIFDTWFTSSLTPQIGSHWLLDPERHARLFPADVRPQSHEIIRTWAFYTIAKAMLHEDAIPWRHVVVSGWVLDPDRKKMSKSHGNVTTPMPLLDQYTADGARYWAASARLGADTAMDEKVFKVGKRLATKVFNAGKFVLAQTAEVHPLSRELDLAFAAQLRGLVGRATDAFEAFNHAQALAETESFFWSRFTDTFIELVKARARSEGDAAGRGSAVAALRLGLNVLLRLLAPFQPHVTEEVWSWVFAGETGQASIHRAPWPGAADFEAVAAPEREDSFDVAVACWSAVNKRKAEAEVSMGREVERLVVAAGASTLARLAAVRADVMAGARVREHGLEERAGLEDGEFAIEDVVFAER
jgi:valyl-tRNA synthetase